MGFAVLRRAALGFVLGIALVLGIGCDGAEEPCDALFGRPNESTGLDDTMCRPVCGCGEDVFVPRDWDEASLAALRGYALLDPPSELSEDPYAAGAPPPGAAEEVCAVILEDPAIRSYRLRTFPTTMEAEAQGALVTHAGACGLCSTLQDLAVYAGTTDLTAPVRQCGLTTALAGLEANVDCLEELGFTRPCAQIWAYNTAHTRDVCGGVCFRLLNAPYHDADGELNACLACDEERSGPVFKAVAGRTRRNSGLASALCRPCAGVPRIAHDYP